MKNPVRAILRSGAAPGLKVIALSLLLVFASALPYMLYATFGPAEGNPVALGWLFAVGAMVAHIGFLVGLVWLMWETYVKNGK